MNETYKVIHYKIFPLLNLYKILDILYYIIFLEYDIK